MSTKAFVVLCTDCRLRTRRHHERNADKLERAHQCLTGHWPYIVHYTRAHDPVLRRRARQFVRVTA